MTALTFPSSPSRPLKYLACVPPRPDDSLPEVSFPFPYPITVHANSAKITTFESYERSRSLFLPTERLGHEQYALPIHSLPILLRLLQPPHLSLLHPSRIPRGLEDKSGRPHLKTTVRAGDCGAIPSLPPDQASLLAITLLRTIIQATDYNTITKFRSSRASLLVKRTWQGSIGSLDRPHLTI